MPAAGSDSLSFLATLAIFSPILILVFTGLALACCGGGKNAKNRKKRRRVASEGEEVGLDEAAQPAAAFVPVGGGAGAIRKPPQRRSMMVSAAANGGAPGSPSGGGGGGGGSRSSRRTSRTVASNGAGSRRSHTVAGASSAAHRSSRRGSHHPGVLDALGAGQAKTGGAAAAHSGASLAAPIGTESQSPAATGAPPPASGGASKARTSRSSRRASTRRSTNVPSSRYQPAPVGRYAPAPANPEWTNQPSTDSPSDPSTVYAAPVLPTDADRAGQGAEPIEQQVYTAGPVLQQSLGQQRALLAAMDGQERRYSAAFLQTPIVNTYKSAGSAGSGSSASAYMKINPDVFNTEQAQQQQVLQQQKQHQQQRSHQREYTAVSEDLADRRLAAGGAASDGSTTIRGGLNDDMDMATIRPVRITTTANQGQQYLALPPGGGQDSNARLVGAHPTAEPVYQLAGAEVGDPNGPDYSTVPADVLKQGSTMRRDAETRVAARAATAQKSAVPLAALGGATNGSDRDSMPLPPPDDEPSDVGDEDDDGLPPPPPPPPGATANADTSGAFLPPPPSRRNKQKTPVKSNGYGVLPEE